MNPAELPIEVCDSEDVIRALKYPYHVKKNGKLKRDAFQPPIDQNVISVIRRLMGDCFCLCKAKEICGTAYIGRAILNVGKIRQRNLEVLDARDDFLGHAHILYLNMDSDTKDDPSSDKIPLFQYLVEIASFEKVDNHVSSPK